MDKHMRLLRRAKQLRDMQMTVARENGLPVIDFAHVWEGYQHFQDVRAPNLAAI